MSNLKEFIDGIKGFHAQSGMDKILTIAWFSEARGNKQSFDTAYIRSCFRDVSSDPPNISMYLQRLAVKKQLLVQGKAYRLSGDTRRKLDAKYGSDVTTIVVTAALADLPAKIPTVSEKIFLTEALNCYKVKAYRAAIIMSWNLAYDHLMQWILTDADRLRDFNDAIFKKMGKNDKLVSNPEGFDEFKEFDVIEFVRVARLVDKSTCQILKEKLSRRNTAAHPSRVVMTQYQADDMISDLVNNVILALS